MTTTSDSITSTISSAPSYPYGTKSSELTAFAPQIERKAFKNAKFKNLVAHVAARSTFLWPMVGVLGMAGLNSLGYVSNGALGYTMAGSFFLCMLTITGMSEAVGNRKAELKGGKKDLSTSGQWHDIWTNILNKGAIGQKKEETQKLILSIQHLKAAKKLTDRDYQLLAQVIIQEKLAQTDLIKWISLMGKSVKGFSDHIKLTHLTLLKQEVSTQTELDFAKLHAAIESSMTTLTANNQVDTALFSQHHEFFFKEVQNYDNGQKTDEKIDNFVNLINTMFEEVQFKMTFAKAPLLNKDYSFLSHFFALTQTSKDKEQFVPTLQNFLEKNKDKINWRKIKESFLCDSKDSQSISSKFMLFIEKELIDYQHKSQQKAILRTAEKLEKIETQPVVSTPHPIAITDLVDYQPTYCPELWANVRKTYRHILTNQDKIDRQTVLNIDRYIKNCLPSIIQADASLGNMSNIFIERTQKLLLEGLTLTHHQLLEVAEKVDAQIVRSLEVNKHYQTMKMGK